MDGQGEWNARKQAGAERRVCRTIHIGIGEQSLPIRAAEFTSSDVGDAPMLPDWLDRIAPEQTIARVTANGACDTRKGHRPAPDVWSGFDHECREHRVRADANAADGDHPVKPRQAQSTATGAAPMRLSGSTVTCGRRCSCDRSRPRLPCGGGLRSASAGDRGRGSRSPQNGSGPATPNAPTCAGGLAPAEKLMLTACVPRPRPVRMGGLPRHDHEEG